MQRAQIILNCQIDGHRQSPIIGVCVNKECQNKRPFCVGCQYQFHNTHIGDLKCFDDLNNWHYSNSKIVEDLKNYLDDLNGLIKKISYLIEATSQRNIYQNFQEMNFTDLHNSINKQIILWNNYKNMCSLLQEIFSATTRYKIKNICSEKYNNFSGQIDSNINTQEKQENLQKKYDVNQLTPKMTQVLPFQQFFSNKREFVQGKIRFDFQNQREVSPTFIPQISEVKLTKQQKPVENYQKFNINLIQQNYESNQRYQQYQQYQNQNFNSQAQNKTAINKTECSYRQQRKKTPNSYRNEQKSISPSLSLSPISQMQFERFSQRNSINYQK